MREFADWASVYSAAPNLPAGVLRGIALYAGVHLYSDAGDVLYVTPQLLRVHTVAGGERTLTLLHGVYHKISRQDRVSPGSHF